MDEGESSEGIDTATSSDSGNEHIDMSDIRLMSNAQASEHVFWQTECILGAGDG